MIIKNCFSTLKTFLVTTIKFIWLRSQLPNQYENYCQAQTPAGGASSTPTSAARSYLKLHSLVELDTFTLTHGPFTPLDTPGKVLVPLEIVVAVLFNCSTVIKTVSCAESVSKNVLFWVNCQAMFILNNKFEKILSRES